MTALVLTAAVLCCASAASKEGPANLKAATVTRSTAADFLGPARRLAYSGYCDANESCNEELRGTNQNGEEREECFEDNMKCCSGYFYSGTISGKDARGECQACPSGKYQPTSNDRKVQRCETCPAGKFQSKAWASSCYSCSPGRYQQNAEQVACKGCPRGYYQSPTMGGLSCTKCAGGRYAAAQSSSCGECAAGKYGNDPTTYEDTNCAGDCPLGKYSSSGQTSCFQCPAGQFGSSDGLTTLNCGGTCPEGKWSTRGQPSCSDCPAGTYGGTDRLETDRCTGKCPAGSFAYVGSTGCTKCPIGKFTLVAAKGSCSVCDTKKAEYQDQVGQTSCKVCAEGGYSYATPDAPTDAINLGSACRQQMPPTLDGYSLVGMVFVSSSAVSQQTPLEGGTGASLMRAAKAVVSKLDRNGDGFIVRAEVVAEARALKLAIDDHDRISGGTPIWCTPLTPGKNGCSTGDWVEVAAVLRDTARTIGILGRFDMGNGPTVPIEVSLATATTAEGSERRRRLVASTPGNVRPFPSSPANRGGTSPVFSREGTSVSVLSGTSVRVPLDAVDDNELRLNPGKQLYIQRLSNAANEPFATRIDLVDQQKNVQVSFDWTKGDSIVTLDNWETVSIPFIKNTPTTGGRSLLDQGLLPPIAEVQLSTTLNTQTPIGMGSLTRLNQFQFDFIPPKRNANLTKKESANFARGFTIQFWCRTGQTSRTGEDYVFSIDSRHTDASEYLNADIATATFDAMTGRPFKFTTMFGTLNLGTTVAESTNNWASAYGDAVGRWQHYSFLYNPKAEKDKLQLFLFGKQVKAIFIASQLPAPTVVTPALMRFCPGDEFDGRLADIRIWARALQCSESNMVDYWREPAVPPDGSKLVGWFLLNPNTAGDSVVNSAGWSDLTPTPSIGSEAFSQMAPAPIDARAMVTFRSLLIFSDQIDHINASSPADYSPNCQNSMYEGFVYIQFNAGLAPTITDRAVYLSGKILPDLTKAGPPSALVQKLELPFTDGNDNQYYPEITFDIGSSQFDSKSIYLDVQDVKCPSTHPTDAQLKITVTGTKLTVVNTNSGGSPGWEEDLSVTCDVLGSSQTYCAGIRTEYAGRGLSFKCAAVLFFANVPVAFQMQLTDYGVQFNFVDTASDETQFEVVRALTPAAIVEGSGYTTVTVIPFGLAGCGKLFSSMTFTDKDTSQQPGSSVVYGIRPVQQGDNTNTGQWAISEYLVPWYGTITVSVQTPGGDGNVEGALIEVCRTDADGTRTRRQWCRQSRTKIDGKAIFVIKVRPDEASGWWLNEDTIAIQQPFSVRPVPVLLSPSCASADIAMGYDTTSQAAAAWAHEVYRLSNRNSSCCFTQPETRLAIAKGDQLYGVAQIYSAAKCAELCSFDNRCGVFLYDSNARNCTLAVSKKYPEVSEPGFISGSPCPPPGSAAGFDCVCNADCKIVEKTNYGCRNSDAVSSDSKDCRLLSAMQSVPTVDQCQQKCTAQAGCRRFTWSNNGTREDYQSCYLWLGDLNEEQTDTEYDSGTGCACSTYSPPDFVAEVAHMGSQTVQFTDDSAVMIEGEVVFSNELELLSGYSDPSIRCPLPEATVAVTIGNKQYTYVTNADGKFVFAAHVGDIVSVVVSVGDNPHQHTFEPPEHSLFVELENDMLQFLDVTQRTVSLQIVEESQQYQLYDSNLKWKLTTYSCQDSKGSRPVSFQLDSPPSQNTNALYSHGTAEAGTYGSYQVPAFGDLNASIAKSPIIYAESFKTSCDQSTKKSGGQLLCTPAQPATAGGELACTLPDEDVVTFFDDLEYNIRPLVLLNDTVTEYWIYETGLCASSAWFVDFPSEDADRCNNDETAEEISYAANIQEQGDALDVRVLMFQIWPSGMNLAVKGSIEVEEVVAGEDSECAPNNANEKNCVYDTTDVCPLGLDTARSNVTELLDCQIDFEVPVGPPKQRTPHLAQMTLLLIRAPYTCDRGPCRISPMMDARRSMKQVRYVAIVGDIEKDGPPQAITASTGPTLVFDVLHDPPGGLSSATWTEGSERKYNIAVDQVDAKSWGTAWTHTFGGGVNGATQAQLAPFGVGVETNFIKGGAKWSDSMSDRRTTPTIANTNSFSSGWALTLKMSKSVSTSADPGTAGKASDLILGGGLEIRFSMEFRFFQNSSKKTLCIASKDVTKWQPSVLTTFLMSYRDIEEQMLRILTKQQRLKTQAAGTSDDDISSEDLGRQAADLGKYYENWQKVVTAYNKATETADQSSGAAGIKAHLANQLNELSDATDKLKFDEQTKIEQRTQFPMGAVRKQRGTDNTTFLPPNMDFYYRDVSKNHLSKSSGKASEAYDTWADKSKQIFDEGAATDPYANLRQICVENMLGWKLNSAQNEEGELADACRNLANMPKDTRSLTARRGNVSVAKMPGSNDTTYVSQGELDALKDDGVNGKSYITFTGGGETLQFTHGISSGLDIKLGVSKAAKADWHATNNVGSDLTITLLNVNYNANKKLDAADSASSSVGHGSGSAYSAQVTWRVGDPDVGDKFVIEVQDNPLYGTPYFRTLGGASKCPAEPNTQKREAKINSMNIVRDLRTCRDSNTPDALCEVRQNSSILWVNFNIAIDLNYQNCIIEDSSGNCDASYQETDYKFNWKLKLKNPYADNVQGLIIMVNGLTMGNSFIPLNGLPFGVHKLSMQVGRTMLAQSSFEDIEVVLISTCENAFASAGHLCIIDQPPAGVIDVAGNTPAPTFPPTNSTADPGASTSENRFQCASPIQRVAKFSVAWPLPTQTSEATQRRATPLSLDEDIAAHSPNVAAAADQTMQQQMHEMHEMHKQMHTQMQQIHTQSQMQMQAMEQRMGHTHQLNIALSISTVTLLAFVVFVAIMPARTAPPTPIEQRSLSPRSISETLPLMADSGAGDPRF